jgi:hypothetical protein
MLTAGLFRILTFSGIFGGSTIVSGSTGLGTWSISYGAKSKRIAGGLGIFSPCPASAIGLRSPPGRVMSPLRIAMPSGMPELAKPSQQ